MKQNSYFWTLSIKEVPFLFSDKSNHFGAVLA